MFEDSAQTRIIVAAGCIATAGLFYYLNRSEPSVKTVTSKVEHKVTETAKKIVRPVFLNKENQKVVLAKKTQISHDVILLRFSLPDKEAILGLPVGKHFKLFAPNKKGKTIGFWNGVEDTDKLEIIERKYTPTSSDDEIGYFELVVKVYNPEKHEKARFLDGGKMSTYLDSLKLGDELVLSGPWGLNEYLGNGKFNFRKKDYVYKHVGMIAGGTGITPMLQIINAVLKSKEDKTKLYLLFANKTEGDILVRDTLDELQQKYSDRLKVHYTLDNPPADWKYSKGFVNEEMIKKALPPPGEETVILLCGPPPMLQYACKPSLDKLGYDKEHIREF